VKKTAAKPKPAAAPGTQYSGGPVQGLRPAPGAAPAPGVIPGGVRRTPAPARKTAARKKPVKRKLALGDTVACCAAEAVAASLRLAGGAVSDADVLALYRLTADGPDAGASILATLEAVLASGLGGCFPAAVREAAPGTCGAGLILGADLPGPHALYDDGRHWWSWGEPHDPADFPAAVIEEAWAVTW